MLEPGIVANQQQRRDFGVVIQHAQQVAGRRLVDARVKTGIDITQLLHHPFGSLAGALGRGTDHARHSRRDAERG